MLRRYWLVAPMVLIGAAMLYGRSALFAPPAAAAPLLLGSFEQSEALVEPAQGRQIPWDYSGKVLGGPHNNCERRCAYRRNICYAQGVANPCGWRYARCRDRCGTWGNRRPQRRSLPLMR